MNLTIEEEKRWGSELCTNFLWKEMLLLLIIPICFSEKVVQPDLLPLFLILLDWASCSFIMATKIKGIYKGFKYISQIFVVKEQEMEMEIGFPTDVKHVAHIGWDGPSASAPSWMNEFKTVPDFAATSIGTINETTRGSNSATPTWSSQEFESMDREPAPDALKDEAPADLPKVPRKQKRRKKKTSSSSSPKSSSSARKSRAVKSKANLVEENAMPPNVEVM